MEQYRYKTQWCIAPPPPLTGVFTTFVNVTTLEHNPAGENMFPLLRGKHVYDFFPENMFLGCKQNHYVVDTATTYVPAQIPGTCFRLDMLWAH